LKKLGGVERVLHKNHNIKILAERGRNNLSAGDMEGTILRREKFFHFDIGQIFET
jgi:hypothetical protein